MAPPSAPRANILTKVGVPPKGRAVLPPSSGWRHARARHLHVRAPPKKLHPVRTQLDNQGAWCWTGTLAKEKDVAEPGEGLTAVSRAPPGSTHSQKVETQANPVMGELCRSLTWARDTLESGAKAPGPRRIGSRLSALSSSCDERAAGQWRQGNRRSPQGTWPCIKTVHKCLGSIR